MSEKLTKDHLELLKKAGYSERAIKLYRDRVNVGVIENPDVALAYVGHCGDAIKLYLKIGEKGVIEDAKFGYLGCPAAASSGSAITRILRWKTLKEAKMITEDDVLKELGGLPESKIHCPKLVVMALRETIAKYEKGKGRHQK